MTVSPDVTDTGASAGRRGGAGRTRYLRGGAAQLCACAGLVAPRRRLPRFRRDGQRSDLPGGGDLHKAAATRTTPSRTTPAAGIRSALSTDNPTASDNPEWAAVSGIRIALPSKESSSTFGVGVPALSPALTSLAEAYATPYAPAGTPVQLLSTTSGGDCTAVPEKPAAASISAGVLTVNVPTTALGDGCQAIVLPPDALLGRLFPGAAIHPRIIKGT